MHIASILSQCNDYFHLHEPFLFSCRFPLYSLSWFFLHNHQIAAIGVSMVVKLTLMLHVQCRRLVNNKNNSYCTRLYIKLAKNMLLWIKIRQKYLQLSIDHTPSCVHFCKKHMQEGERLLYTLFQITTSRKAQVNLSMPSTFNKAMTALLQWYVL